MSIIHNIDDAARWVTKENVITDIPAVKFWLPCDEVGPALTVLTDAIQGLTLENLTPFVGDGIKANTHSQPQHAVTGGSLPDLPGDFAFLMGINASAGFGGFILGDGPPLISLLTAEGAVTGSDGTASIDVINAGGVDLKYLIKADASGKTQGWQATVGSPLTMTKNPDYADNGPLVNFTNKVGIQSIGVTSLVGIAVIDLSNASAESIDNLEVYADWIMEQWFAGNKVFPERFKTL